MTLKFRKVQRKVLSGDDKDKVKTYAMARSSNYCDMDKLCELISSRSAMSSVDVKAILDSLNWAMSLELRSGSIVQVGEFGSFRLSIRSKGAETGCFQCFPDKKGTGDILAGYQSALDE